MTSDARGSELVRGRLVLDDRVVVGTLRIENGQISAVEVENEAESGGTGRDAEGTRAQSDEDLPFVAPGFVDLHVHGWGGHDAMGPAEALDGMARALLAHGVTSFLPTAVTAPMADLTAFASRAREWSEAAPEDGAAPLGFNLEGPFISAERKGAQNPAFIQDPEHVAREELEPLIEGMRLMTVAPEIPGAVGLIEWLRDRGVAASMGHSASTLQQARTGYASGGRTTTHLFNAMSGIDHHAPGLAVAALTDDEAWVELIADGHHVDRALWPIITRTKPTDRLILVSDAIPLAGTGQRRAVIGGMEVEIEGDRCTLANGGPLAGSVIALDTAVRNLVEAGVPLPDAVAAASRNPLALLGVTDRGRLQPGQRADLVELDAGLVVRRVMRAGVWHPGAASR